MVGLLPLEECILVRIQVWQNERSEDFARLGFERERGRENILFSRRGRFEISYAHACARCIPVGKPWVSQKFAIQVRQNEQKPRSASNLAHTARNTLKYASVSAEAAKSLFSAREGAKDEPPMPSIRCHRKPISCAPRYFGWSDCQEWMRYRDI